MIEGNNVGFCLHEDDCEIKADITVTSRDSVRLWGQITDCNGEPVTNALVKLLCVGYFHGKPVYESIANAVTDCAGFYQFDLERGNAEKDSCGEREYRLIAGKSIDAKDCEYVERAFCDEKRIRTCYACD